MPAIPPTPTLPLMVLFVTVQFLIKETLIAAPSPLTAPATAPTAPSPVTDTFSNVRFFTTALYNTPKRPVPDWFPLFMNIPVTLCPMAS